MNLFGTDGIRGEYGQWPLTPEFAYRLGCVLYEVTSVKAPVPLLVIGRDTRASGSALFQSLCSGFIDRGGRIKNVGVVPTPLVAFAVVNLGAQMGIAITASHNPPRDNGFKFFGADGIKISDDEQRELEQLLQKASPTRREIGSSVDGSLESTAAREYLKFLSKFYPQNWPATSIYVDCANGATSDIAGTVFTTSRGFKLAYAEPDGTNINVGCGAEEAAHWTKRLKESDSDWAFVFDGDGDRFVLVHRNEGLIRGEYLIALFADLLTEERRGSIGSIAVSIGANAGILGYLERGGHDVETAPVGDRAISHALLASGGIFGAEESGHYVFMGDHIAGDGIFAALSLLRLTDGNLDIVLKYADKRILLPEARANVVVKNKVASGEEELLPIRETIRYAETKLDGVGRILVRPSGTEPKYRVFVEAAKQELADALVSQIAGVIAKARG